MIQIRTGAVAVIFVSQRTEMDPEGYARAAAEMEREVAQAPGYLGHDSLSSGEGSGITVSYWQDHASAAAWRDHARHGEIRAEGRAHWYRWYRLVVADVARGYEWHK